MFKQKKSICAPYIKHCLTLHFSMSTTQAERNAERNKHLNRFIRSMFGSKPTFSSGTPTTANSFDKETMFKVTKGSITRISPAEVGKGFEMYKVSFRKISKPNSDILKHFVVPKFYLTQKDATITKEDKIRIAAFIVLSTIDDGEAFRTAKDKLRSFSTIVKSLEGEWKNSDYIAEAKQEKKELKDYFKVVLAAIKDDAKNTTVEPQNIDTAVSVRKAFNVALINFIQNTSCDMKAKFPSAGSGASGSRTVSLGKFSVFKVATSKDTIVLKGITENALSSTKTKSGNARPNPINGGYTWAIFTTKDGKTIIVGSSNDTYNLKKVKKLLKGKVAKAEFDHIFYTSKASSSIQRRATKKTSARLPGEDKEVNPGKLRAIFLAMMNSQ